MIKGDDTFMGKYFFEVEIEDEYLDDIFKNLDEAQRTVYDCASKLHSLKIITLKKSDEDDSDS